MRDGMLVPAAVHGDDVDAQALLVSAKERLAYELKSEAIETAMIADGDMPSTALEPTSALGQRQIPILLSRSIDGVTHYAGVAMLLLGNGDGTANAPVVALAKAIAAHLLRAGDAQPILAD